MLADIVAQCGAEMGKGEFGRGSDGPLLLRNGNWAQIANVSGFLYERTREPTLRFPALLLLFIFPTLASQQQ